MVRSTENRDNRSAKARILEVYEMDGNWKALAENLSIPKTALYRWLSKGKQSDTRGGPRNCKVKQVHLDFIQTLMDENPMITLKVISGRIEAQFGFKLSKSTVAKHLDMMTYTLKAVRFVPERANLIENKNKRSLFCSKLLNYQSTGKPILFMDETNFNLHISRRNGRSAGTQGANIHVIGCIGPHGLVYHEIQRGSFRKESAQSWMQECLRAAKRQYGGPVVMVVDNAPCHSNIEEVFNEKEFLGCEVLRLGPYSPMFNPIEQVWSLIKANIKQELGAKIVIILAKERRDGLSITEQRARALTSLIEEELVRVIPNVCNRFIAGIQSKIDVVF